MGDSYISTEHFFLAALKTAREIQRILEHHGVTARSFEAQLMTMRGKQK